MNKETFSGYVVEYKTMVRSAILKVIPSLSYDDELDDLEQEAWAKAWASNEQYDESKSKIQTWLHRIATSVAIDYLRAQAAQKRPTLVFTADHAATDGGMGQGLSESPYYEASPAVSEFGADAMPPHAPSAEDEAIRVQVAEDIAKRIEVLGQRERDILSLSYD